MESHKKKVIEYLGPPKNKTINDDEILNWAPTHLVENKEEYSLLEMYVYTYEDGEARLFFSNGLLLYKQPLKLNMSDQEYFDTLILK